MNQNLITFRSVTYAQRGERSLTRRGIGCTVMRTPKWMEDQGCGYGLRLRGKDLHRALDILHRALDILRQEDISWRKVYGFTREGRAEELAL